MYDIIVLEWFGLLYLLTFTQQHARQTDRTTDTDVDRQRERGGGRGEERERENRSIYTSVVK